MTGAPDVECDRCGFRADDYSARDLRTAPGWLTQMLVESIEGAPADLLGRDGTAGPLGAGVAAARAAIAALGDDPAPETVHGAVHAVRDVGRVRHELGAGCPTQQGTIAQINTWGGGVPKLPVPSADVGRRGLVSDRQANRKHHGRPFQALCLWSAEVIDALAAEGHPIRPGAAGENLTIGGIDWSTIRPGARVLAGQVLCELSAWATPCRKNDQWFTGRSDRIDHEIHPGWSRIYAWVLEPGTITAGDEVVVEP